MDDFDGALAAAEEAGGSTSRAADDFNALLTTHLTTRSVEEEQEREVALQESWRRQLAESRCSERQARGLVDGAPPNPQPAWGPPPQPSLRAERRALKRKEREELLREEHALRMLQKEEAPLRKPESILAEDFSSLAKSVAATAAELRKAAAAANMTQSPPAQASTASGIDRPRMVGFKLKAATKLKATGSKASNGSGDAAFGGCGSDRQRRSRWGQPTTLAATAHVVDPLPSTTGIAPMRSCGGGQPGLALEAGRDAPRDCE